MQELILVCGMPGSGKTTFADNLADKPGYVHIDVDDFYQKINGDSKDRSHKFEVWQAFYKAIHDAYLDGNSVIADAMSLTAYNRREIAEWFPEFERHRLIYIDASFDTCMNNVSVRERTISVETMRKYFCRVELPRKVTDGAWDVVAWYYNDGSATRFLGYNLL